MEPSKRFVYLAMEVYKKLLSHPSNHKHVAFMEAIKLS
jgi:hypothetical protein